MMPPSAPLWWVTEKCSSIRSIGELPRHPRYARMVATSCANPIPCRRLDQALFGKPDQRRGTRATVPLPPPIWSESGRSPFLNSKTTRPSADFSGFNFCEVILPRAPRIFSDVL